MTMTELQVEVVGMRGVEPYDAWFFFAADDIDDVNRQYLHYTEEADGGYWVRWPADGGLVDFVKVIAVEVDRGVDHVWFVRKGMAERRPSWMVRAKPERGWLA